jgi:hypothetical protein
MNVTDTSKGMRQADDWRYIWRILRQHMIVVRHRIGLGRDAAGRSNTDGPGTLSSRAQLCAVGAAW